MCTNDPQILVAIFCLDLFFHVTILPYVRNQLSKFQCKPTTNHLCSFSSQFTTQNYTWLTKICITTYTHHLHFPKHCVSSSSFLFTEVQIFISYLLCCCVSLKFIFPQPLFNIVHLYAGHNFLLSYSLSFHMDIQKQFNHFPSSRKIHPLEDEKLQRTT